MVYIYYLYDPVSKAPFYVGSTKNPKSRMADHTCSAHYNNYGRTHFSKKERLIYDRYQQGIKVEMVIIEQVPSHLGKIREKYHYTRLKWEGYTLLNTAKNLSV